MIMKTVSKSLYLVANLALSAVLACACGDATHKDSETKIFGGTPTVAGDWLNTVALTDTFGGVFCSGTAVTPLLVVTAAHCADTGLSAGDIRVYVGAGQAGGLFLGANKIVRIVANPEYAPPSALDHDVSYVLLEKPLPLAKSAFIPLPNAAESAELLKAGKLSRIIGFGNREHDEIGVKYQVDAPITAFNKTEVRIGGRGKDSCQGDSGGPVFGQLANGQWRFMAVVSRGGSCGEGGIYGLIRANMCWIQSDSGIDLGLAKGSCAVSE